MPTAIFTENQSQQQLADSAGKPSLNSIDDSLARVRFYLLDVQKHLHFSLSSGTISINPQISAAGKNAEVIMGFKFGSFVFGGLVGAGLALLFAPRSGVETRALLTDKAEELWGDSQDLYGQGVEKIKAGVSNAQETAVKTNDELRKKIESARVAISEQVAKNAQSALNAINAQVPVAGEKITQAVDVVRGQIDAAASKLKSAAADLAARDADAQVAEAAAGQAATAEVDKAASEALANQADAAAAAAPNVADAAAQASETVVADAADKAAAE